MVPTQKTENIIKDIQNAQLTKALMSQTNSIQRLVKKLLEFPLVILMRVNIGNTHGKMEEQAPNIKLSVTTLQEIKCLMHQQMN